MLSLRPIASHSLGTAIATATPFPSVLVANPHEYLSLAPRLQEMQTPLDPKTPLTLSVLSTPQHRRLLNHRSMVA